MQRRQNKRPFPQMKKSKSPRYIYLLRIEYNHPISRPEGDYHSMNYDIKMMINGKKIIGEGARRLVYDLGNGNVLKVAKSKYGIRSNKREVKTFNSASSRVKKYIAKIRKYDKRFYWLIMKKYGVHFPKSKKYKKKLHKVRTKFRGNGIIPYEVVSHQGKPNFQNLRLKTNGKIVVIDYGNFEFCRKLCK